MKSWKFLAPLALFVVLLVFLGVGLNLKPREVPSPLINKPAPAFVLPRLDDPAQTLSLKDMAGQVWIFNVWASWCTPCLDEHPLLVEFARTHATPVVGLNYKDGRKEAQTWLMRHGNPYKLVLSDSQGKVGIDYGVYGVPETYVIDKTGMVRFKHIGPLTPEVLRDSVEPLLKKLNG